jgi:nucleotide-binding universal stress UspA family protein
MGASRSRDGLIAGWPPLGRRASLEPNEEETNEGGAVANAIICGVDDSESAKGAARVARALSRELGRALVFVRVAEPDSSEETISSIVERLERLSMGASDVDPGAGWLIDVGHPADRLVAAAAEERASMIVLGSTGPRSSLLGSISADVSRRAPCPVVVVPPGADEGVKGQVTAEDERDNAGGIARFALGGGGTELEGGIVRFGLRSASEPKSL